MQLTMSFEEHENEKKKKTIDDVCEESAKRERQEEEKPQYGYLVKTLSIARLYVAERLKKDIQAELRNRYGLEIDTPKKDVSSCERIIKRAEEDMQDFFTKNEFSRLEFDDELTYNVASAFAVYVALKSLLERSSDFLFSNQRDENVFSLYAAAVEGQEQFSEGKLDRPGISFCSIDFELPKENMLENMLKHYSGFIDYNVKKGNITCPDDFRKATYLYFKGLAEEMEAEEEKQRTGIQYEVLEVGKAVVSGIGGLKEF